jgi:hypothetical protein
VEENKCICPESYFVGDIGNATDKSTMSVISSWLYNKNGDLMNWEYYGNRAELNFVVTYMTLHLFKWVLLT